MTGKCEPLKLFDYQHWNSQKRCIKLLDVKPFEPLFEQMFSRVQPGWVVIDVGAAVGYYTIKVGLAVGHNGKVLAIEPHPQMLHALKMNVKFYKLKNVVVIPRAVGNQKGMTKLYEAKNPHGSHTYPPRPLSSLDRQWFFEKLKNLRSMNLKRLVERFSPVTNPTARTKEVIVDTLDSIVENSGLTKIDMIKMDIQGSEFLALQGARSILANQKPLLLVEVHNREGWCPEDLFDFLRDFGYNIKKQKCHGDILVVAEGSQQISICP